MTKRTEEEKGNTIVRNNATRPKSEEDFEKEAYFGFIRKEEDFRGGYHDFSLVFFPQKDINSCVVALGVGQLGFLNDNDKASLPWVRRLFTRLRRQNAKTFFKNDFGDTQSPSLDLKEEVDRNYKDLSAVIDNYKNVLPAAEILDFSDPSKDGQNMNIVRGWIATYAYLRNWPRKNDQSKLVDDNMPNKEKHALDKDAIYDILKNERFVVLQGAPGTGKTYSALEVAKRFNKDNVFFEQFHAETTYSDFICGIRPKLDTTNLSYEKQKGRLYEAIEYALKPDVGDVLLIIDEINRANLSNVLGPVFYLFEKNQNNHNYKIKIDDDIELEKLPDNLYVLATMNTADRSLAVVDFALRRRFTWLTLKPHPLEERDLKDCRFWGDYYKDFDRLFEKYATDDELNLQPGQSYFIADDSDKMLQRVRYELMPLIKEYINEGFLVRAKDEFSNYFYKKLGVLMYE